jgi:hypothetical protein
MIKFLRENIFHNLLHIAKKLLTNIKIFWYFIIQQMLQDNFAKSYFVKLFFMKKSTRKSSAIILDNYEGIKVENEKKIEFESILPITYVCSKV